MPKKVKSPIFIVIGMLILASIACNFSFSTANIDNVQLARDENGNDRTDTFSPTDTIYVLFDLKNAPDDSTVKAVWKFVDVEGEESNDQFAESDELTTGSAAVWFSFVPGAQGMPEGKYKVEIYLNDEREETREFTVATSD